MATATETYRYSRLRIHYFDVDVPAVAVGRGIYFPLKALCQVLGIAPQAQAARLKSELRFKNALRELPIPTIKGRRDATCIRKQDVGEWLLSIESSHCALAARGPLERFRSELFAAADRWLFGDNSDVVYDPGAKTDKPITGVLHLGECPRCGLALCLVMDEDGSHLRPASGEDDV